MSDRDLQYSLKRESLMRSTIPGYVETDKLVQLFRHKYGDQTIKLDRMGLEYDFLGYVLPLGDLEAKGWEAIECTDYLGLPPELTEKLDKEVEHERFFCLEAEEPFCESIARSNAFGGLIFDGTSDPAAATEAATAFKDLENLSAKYAEWQEKQGV
jgi:hypothetical protein